MRTQTLGRCRCGHGLFTIRSVLHHHYKKHTSACVLLKDAAHLHSGCLVLLMRRIQRHCCGTVSQAKLEAAR